MPAAHALLIGVFIMAQTLLTGRVGNVIGLACRLFMWQCNLHTDSLDSTGFGSTFRNRTPGFQDLRAGRAGARLTRGTAGDDPTVLFSGGEFQITLVANNIAPLCQIGALCVVSDIEFVVNTTEISIVTFSFESDGVVQTEWDET
jgi:hypothetical protein